MWLAWAQVAAGMPRLRASHKRSVGVSEGLHTTPKCLFKSMMHQPVYLCYFPTCYVVNKGRMHLVCSPGRCAPLPPRLRTTR